MDRKAQLREWTAYNLKNLRFYSLTRGRLKQMLDYKKFSCLFERIRNINAVEIIKIYTNKNNDNKRI